MTATLFLAEGDKLETLDKEIEAAHRDPDGTLHECSAACPHLGCIVHWNGSESTWDCPCHGSRFDCHGKVINGPANRDLASVERAERKRAA